MEDENSLLGLNYADYRIIYVAMADDAGAKLEAIRKFLEDEPECYRQALYQALHAAGHRVRGGNWQEVFTKAWAATTK